MMMSEATPLELLKEFVTHLPPDSVRITHRHGQTEIAISDSNHFDHAVYFIFDQDGLISAFGSDWK